MGFEMSSSTTTENRRSVPCNKNGLCSSSNWSTHGFLKRGLRRWGSTGSWVIDFFLKKNLKSFFFYLLFTGC